MVPAILALDLSLTCTGYCRDGECGRIATKLRGWARLDLIVSEVCDLAIGADLVVLEGYSFGSKGASVFQLAELGGIVRWELQGRSLPYIDVPPATLKRFATGKGNADKDAMIAAAIRRFGYGGDDNNEADAYLLWCLARHAYGQPVASVPAAHVVPAGAIAWPMLEAVSP
jgi:Holliday junction resolvasome RuvABC endonuclease subunit